MDDGRFYCLTCTGKEMPLSITVTTEWFNDVLLDWKK